MMGRTNSTKSSGSISNKRKGRRASARSDNGPQTGSIAANYHEANRSEYLAQYVFSAFGTSLPVLRAEDHGLDLYCTLTERHGQRAWPIAYYSVQIKSTDEPLVFRGKNSIEWLLDYPAPLLLCVVDKKDARVRIYQTMARFTAAVSMELPSKLTLVPGVKGKERLLRWDDEGNCLLGPPILDFTVTELLSDESFELYRQVLRFWVLCDQENIRRYKMGVRSMRLPPELETNAIPRDATGQYYLNYATDEMRTKAEATAFELDEWLAPVKLAAGDKLGALLTALMLRHQNQDYRKGPGAGFFMDLRSASNLNANTGSQPDDYVFAPYDKLLRELKEKLGE